MSRPAAIVPASEQAKGGLSYPRFQRRLNAYYVHAHNEIASAFPASTDRKKVYCPALPPPSPQSLAMGLSVRNVAAFLLVGLVATAANAKAQRGHYGGAVASSGAAGSSGATSADYRRFPAYGYGSYFPRSYSSHGYFYKCGPSRICNINITHRTNLNYCCTPHQRTPVRVCVCKTSGASHSSWRSSFWKRSNLFSLLQLRRLRRGRLRLQRRPQQPVCRRARDLPRVVRGGRPQAVRRRSRRGQDGQAQGPLRRCKRERFFARSANEPGSFSSSYRMISAAVSACA